MNTAGKGRSIWPEQKKSERYLKTSLMESLENNGHRLAVK